MSNTRIFVSSTCFDLAQVRDDVYRTITELGHCPVMSEFNSFPVLPDLTTIQNCTRNVRENSDLFVLIVGGRRGSVEPASNRSIVNIEFEAAKSYRLDTLVFIYEPVLTLLPIWENNPVADFSPAVDSPEVFAFVKTIRNGQLWTFPFKRADDIAQVLKAQLSVFLRYLIERKRSGKLDPLQQFANESDEARTIALDRPPLWEYKLTAELLRTRTGELAKRLSDLERGLLLRPNRLLSGRQTINWLREKLADLEALVEMIRVAVMEEIRQSWGPPGTPGDPLQILSAVNKFYEGCSALIEWEADIRMAHPPDALLPVKEAMSGSAADIFHQVEPLLIQLDEALEQARQHAGSEPLNVVVTITFAFPRSERVMAAVTQANLTMADWLD